MNRDLTQVSGLSWLDFSHANLALRPKNISLSEHVLFISNMNKERNILSYFILYIFYYLLESYFSLMRDKKGVNPDERRRK